MSDDPGDDEKTPPRPARRPVSAWDDDKRATVGREHRSPFDSGPPSTDSERARRRAARSFARGVPITLQSPAIPDLIERELGGPGEVPEHEITEPWALLDREQLTADELKIIQRSKRDSTDPATYADVVKLTDRLIKKQLDDRSANKAQADQLLKLLAHPPHESVTKLQALVATLEQDVGGLKRWWKPWRAAIVFLAITAVGSLGFFVDQLLAGAERKGETTIRLDHLEKAILDLRQDLRDDRTSRRYEPADRPSWLAPPHLPAKDPKP